MADHPPSGRRWVLSVVAGAGAAALGALILGEYDFSGATPYLAGVLFGLVVSEVVLTVARHGSVPLAALSAAEAGAGLGWAVWISSGRGRAPIPGAAWIAIAIGVVVAAAWVGLPARTRARRTQQAPQAQQAPRTPHDLAGHDAD